MTDTSLEGLYEVEVIVKHSKSGKAIYSLTTLLFDPPVAPASELPAQGTAPQKPPLHKSENPPGRAGL